MPTNCPAGVALLAPPPNGSNSAQPAHHEPSNPARSSKGGRRDHGEADEKVAVA